MYKLYYLKKILAEHMTKHVPTLSEKQTEPWAVSSATTPKKVRRLKR